MSCIYFMNLVIPRNTFNKFSVSVNPVHTCVCVSRHPRLHYVYAYESGLVIECAQVPRVISLSDRMMLGEAVHINPIHICKA